LEEKKGYIVASDDPGAGSLACCALMGVNTVVGATTNCLARQEGMMPPTLDAIEFNQPLAPFMTIHFRLRTKPYELGGGCSFSQRITNAAHLRFVDRRILGHRVIYSVRKNQFAARILYGDLGPPKLRDGATRI